jgi:predicted DNA-binding antitoxin AbrB/MazE fold protein
MKQFVEAIYEDGVFRPVLPLELPVGERVRVEIDVQPKVDVAAMLADFQKVYDGFSSKEIDELEKVVLDRSNFARRESAN